MLPAEAHSGLIPAMPAIKKYVCVRLKRGERTKAVMVEAALISASPVISSQRSPDSEQCASGNKGEKPGTVTLLAVRPSDSCDRNVSPSGANCFCIGHLSNVACAATPTMLMMNSFGAITSSLPSLRPHRRGLRGARRGRKV